MTLLRSLLEAATPTTRYRFWWKEGSRTKYVYGDGGDEHPADWVGNRKEAEEMRQRLLTFDALTEDAEWGIDTREFPLYGVAHDGVVVMLSEEYGYREWMWKTGMSAEALVKWWAEMESVMPHFMDPSATLPGEMVHIWYCGKDQVFTQMPDKSIRYIQIPDNRWTGHIHTDDDSGIRTPTGESILHNGYEEECSEE